MNTLELAVPPPAVMLLNGLLMGMLLWLFPAFTVLPLQSLAGAITLVLAGAGISMAGIISFRLAQTTMDPRKPADTSALVTSGIYRYTRNPMYLGTWIILIGWGIFLGNVLSLISTFLFVVYISRFQIQPEERLLQDKFGAEFTSYKSRVRRWV